MKKHSYTIIALLVLAGPLAMSFDSKVFFFQYIIPVLLSTFFIGAVYILWDVIVTRQGHWAFNDEFVGEKRILHLPLGEWLFFLCVPYATLFIFEVMEAYFGPGRPQPELWWIQALASLPFFGLVYPFRHRGYTRLAMGAAGAFMLVSAVLAPGLIFSHTFWLFMLFSFLAFAVVNGIYCSLPTIRYSPTATTGIRIGTIPVEDFVYNLSYLGLTLAVYIPLKFLLGLEGGWSWIW